MTRPAPLAGFPRPLPTGAGSPLRPSLDDETDDFLLYSLAEMDAPIPVITPDGMVAERPTVDLTPKDAQLLREYQRFLQRVGLREALYCQTCWDLDLHDGCRAYVTPTEIVIECRCTKRRFLGGTI